MRAARAKPECAGFTFLELAMLVLVMAGLIAVLLPPLLPGRHYHRPHCLNNLKQIGLSFKTWSIDNQDRFPMQVSTNEGGTKELVKGLFAYAHFAVMSNELSTPKILLCPQDRQRTAATNFGVGFGNQNLSYFVGLEATDTNPASFLAGDRNVSNGTPLVRGLLTLYTNRQTGWTRELHSQRINHRREAAGTLGLADGSVCTLTSTGLHARTLATEHRTRLAIP